MKRWELNFSFLVGFIVFVLSAIWLVSTETIHFTWERAISALVCGILIMWGSQPDGEDAKAQSPGRNKNAFFFALCVVIVPLAVNIGDHSENIVKIIMSVCMFVGVSGMVYFSWLFQRANRDDSRV